MFVLYCFVFYYVLLCCRRYNVKYKIELIKIGINEENKVVLGRIGNVFNDLRDLYIVIGGL